MKIIPQLRAILNTRIQFIEQLALMVSFNEVIDINKQKLKMRHLELEAGQIKTIKVLLGAIRIDDTVKKDYHKVIIGIFKKIDPGVCLRAHSTGKLKDITEDYIQFFIRMKQKNILTFLGGIFELNIYNQNTILYVLIQILLKYFRIKTLALLDQDDPPPTLNIPKPSFHETPSRIKNSPLCKKRTPLKKQSKRINTEPKKTIEISPRCKTISVTRMDRHREKGSHKKLLCKDQRVKTNLGLTLQIKQKFLTKSTNKSNIEAESRQSSDCMTEGWGIGAYDRFERNYSHYTDSSTKKRRVIKSYKEKKQATEQKIIKANSILYSKNLAKAFSSANRQVYLKSFFIAYEEEWDQYLNLTGLSSLSKHESPIKCKVNESQRNTGRRNEQPKRLDPSRLALAKRKKEWQSKNLDRVLVESCYRNDRIRKEMENYFQSFNTFLHS